ncbi:hypothetical protein BH10PAT1_BH10PAT1_2930 [soil metagenome]
MREKKVVLFPFRGSVFLKNNIFNINNGNNIFFGFKDKLKKHGVEINTFDIHKGVPDWCVYCDVPYPWELNKWRYLIFNKSKSILLCFESPLVNPFSHINLFLIFFCKVYTWNDRLVDGRKIKKFYIPNTNNGEFEEISFNKKKLLTLINSNKSTLFLFWLLSPFKIDLYKKRVDAINFFEKELKNDFDLYGKGWDKNKSKKYFVYKGVIKNDKKSKIDTLSKYKFAICFENCAADGYVSEKIIDCLEAHVIPIYYGPKNITEYIPQNVFVNFEYFKDLESLLSFIKDMTIKEYNLYIKRGLIFLNSKKFKSLFFEKKFEKTFLESIS